MAEMTAEKFAQRAFDLNLIEGPQLESVWGEIGTRDVALDDFVSLVVRKELLTNFQVERLLKGERKGFFYDSYKVLYLVGSGTFARVYRAVHTETGKVVAVKVLRQRYSDDEETTEQFLREAKMVQKLRHPNIVPIYEVLSDRNRPFMVMEFVEGRNLRDFVRVRKGLQVDESLRLIADVCSGLEYALEKGVTHRDLKLSNVLVTSRGRAKLVDFGLAGFSEEKGDRAGAPRSIDYAGLERITGVRKNDPRSDIFFAGCMLYHMISGHAPLSETRDRSKRLSTGRYREIKPVTEWISGVPPYVVTLIHKAMELNPEKRYATPSEMLLDVKHALQRVEKGDSGETSPPGEEPADAGTVAAARGTTAAANPTDLEQEGDNKTVMIVESKIELQDALREQLKRRGYRVLVTSDPDRALQRFEDNAELADAVVFCTTELGHAALDAFNRFGRSERTREIPAILFVDKSQQDLIQAAERSESRVLLAMPIRVSVLRAALIKLLAARTPS
ncbi:MAG: protein kinase [Pirellulaceae bacterium]|nr:protein kinase [Pirellulaceae bacterium]